MNFTSLKWIVCCCLCVGFWSCSNESDDDGENPPIQIDVVESIVANLNPSGRAPLTAELIVLTKQEVAVRIRIVGKNGAFSDVVHTFDKFGDSFTLPVYGLYANYNNQVELTFLNEDGAQIDQETIRIQTEELLPDMPEIELISSKPDQMKPGFSLVNYFGYFQFLFPQKAFMMDAFGEIRWYLDYTEDPVLKNLFYDVGMIRLQNGNLAFGDGSTGSVYEVNLFGEIVNSYFLQGYGFHHAIYEKPNGNFLVTVNDFSRETREDVILEIDRNTKQIINTWDLTVSLDKNRKTWIADERDWSHANGVTYDPNDNTIIVSLRSQGVIKLTAENEVVWILAPHRGWNQAGNGKDLKQYLLQPLNANGDPIQEDRVLNGDINEDDFSWSWYQHSPVLKSNGNLIIFDNGDNRLFFGFGPYSRAVEYKIDAENRTIQQVWAYGEELGNTTFSRIVSRVDAYEEVDNVLFAPGAINNNQGSYGQVIELDRTTKELVFNARIYAPQRIAAITFHSILRFPIYPE